jgi:hypothetical protein
MEILEKQVAARLNSLFNHEDYSVLEAYLKKLEEKLLNEVFYKLGEERIQAIGKLNMVKELLNLKAYAHKELTRDGS